MSEEYVREAEAERAESAAEQLAVDMQEASSIRYGTWLRIAILTSGRWAIYHGTEAETGAKEIGNIQIVDSLDPEYLRGLSLNEQAQAEERYNRALARLESDYKPTVMKSTQTLEEMEL